MNIRHLRDGNWRLVEVDFETFQLWNLSPNTWHRSREGHFRLLPVFARVLPNQRVVVHLPADHDSQTRQFRKQKSYEIILFLQKYSFRDLHNLLFLVGVDPYVVGGLPRGIPHHVGDVQLDLSVFHCVNDHAHLPE